MQALTGIYDYDKEEWILPPMFHEVGDKNGEVYLLFPALSDCYDSNLDEEEKSEPQKALEETWGELQTAIFLVNTKEKRVLSLDDVNQHRLSGDYDTWTIDYKNKVIFHWNSDERTCLMDFKGKAIIDDCFVEYEAYPSLFVGSVRDENDDETTNVYRYDGEIIYDDVKDFGCLINHGYSVFGVRNHGNTSNILLLEDKYIGMYDEIYHFEKGYIAVKDEDKHHIINVKTKKSVYTSDYAIESFSIDKSDSPSEYMSVKHDSIKVSE